MLQNKQNQNEYFFTKKKKKKKKKPYILQHHQHHDFDFLQMHLQFLKHFRYQVLQQMEQNQSIPNLVLLFWTIYS